MKKRFITRTLPVAKYNARVVNMKDLEVLEEFESCYAGSYDEEEIKEYILQTYGYEGDIAISLNVISLNEEKVKVEINDFFKISEPVKM